MQFDANERPLGRLLDAPAALTVEGGSHIVALVEHDDALEVGLLSPTGEPLDDLLQPVDAGLDTVPLTGLAFQRVVAREADALNLLDWSLARSEVEHEVRRAAERRPVADGVAHEVAVLAHPEGAAATLEHVVEDDRGRLAAFPDPGPVAEEEPLARSDFLAGARQMLRVGRARPADGLQLGVGEVPPRHQVLGQRRAVVARRRRGRGHRGRLDEPRRVRARARDLDAGTVGVEHARRERAGLSDLPGCLDHQWASVRERPRGQGLAPGCHRRPRAGWRGAQAGDAGCEEGEEVELLDRVVCRSGRDVRCRGGHGISGWLMVRSLSPGHSPVGSGPPR